MTSPTIKVLNAEIGEDSPLDPTIGGVWISFPYEDPKLALVQVWDDNRWITLSRPVNTN